MKQLDERQIHVRLPVELYKDLRIRCVQEDKSVQEFVTDILKVAVQPEVQVQRAEQVQTKVDASTNARSAIRARRILEVKKYGKR